MRIIEAKQEREVLIVAFAPNPPRIKLLEVEKELLKSISAGVGWSLVTVEEAFVARFGEAELLDAVEAFWRIDGLDALERWAEEWRHKL